MKSINEIAEEVTEFITHYDQVGFYSPFMEEGQSLLKDKNITLTSSECDGVCTYYIGGVPEESRLELLLAIKKLQHIECESFENDQQMRGKIGRLGLSYKLFSISNEILKLSKIGGHKIYHTEGSAFFHTCLVVMEMAKLRPNDTLAIKAAWLHDIGKVYTSIRHSHDDWEYPDHSTCGGFRGILSKFIAESDPDFKVLQWLITNHIKPLFWQKNGVNVTKSPFQTKENMELLRDLAICDIRGSITNGTVDNKDLIEYLTNLTF